MKSGLGWTLVWGVLIAAGLVTPGRRAVAGNCALYARAETGVFLFGAAGDWWDEAAGLYQRGHVPTVGSILVFQRTGPMPSGHVAIVSKVIGPGQILVDQSNWYHGRVTEDTPVIDTSPDHDWTSVAVMNIGSGEFGRDSPTYGFVYPKTGSPDVVAARETSGFDPSLASRAAYEPGAHPDLFHFAVASDAFDPNEHYRRTIRYRRRAKYPTYQHHRRLADRGHWHASVRYAHWWAARASTPRSTHASAVQSSRG
jgi:surface antigen